jgi:hypothetical protein
VVSWEKEVEREGRYEKHSVSLGIEGMKEEREGGMEKLGGSRRKSPRNH